MFDRTSKHGGSARAVEELPDYILLSSFGLTDDLNRTSKNNRKRKEQFPPSLAGIT